MTESMAAVAVPDCFVKALNIMACEYILFDESLRDRFMSFASGLGIPAQTRADPMDGWVVQVPDDLDDPLLETLEREYDTLLDEQRRLVVADDGPNARNLMAVQVELPDGQTCLVRLPADYGNRLVEHFTLAEIQELIAIIAREASNPDSGPICRQT